MSKVIPWAVRICGLCGEVKRWVGPTDHESKRFRVCDFCDDIVPL